MEDEEDILVKYRMRGETEWHLKKEAVMTLGKTQWAIRLKLCKQGDGHNYYSLHIVFLTKGRTARAQIKCHREGEAKTDWLQEYDFGGFQNVLVNPCLMKIENREKITFIVEIKLIKDQEEEFKLGNEIFFPNADFGLLVEKKKLMVDKEYFKRRAPLLSSIFDGDGEVEKKEHDLTDQNIDFQDLVDCFGVFQHHWPFEAPRLIQLIPIARQLGFDIWGKALNREFTQLIYRNEPVKIESYEEEPTETFDFNEPIIWTIDEVSKLTESTVASNQHVLLSTANNKRNCLCYVYTKEYFDSKYLSFGFQMTRDLSEPTTSTEDVPIPDSPESPPPSPSQESDESIELGVPDSPEAIPDLFPEFFDITIAIHTSDGNLVCCDKIKRVRDDDYVIVGSPVFQRLVNIKQYVSDDDKLTVEINWKESSDDPIDDTYTLPGVTDCNIICEHVVLKANKEFLAHHSDYFRALFFGRFVESKQNSIDLGTEEFSTFKSALEMIYNRRLTICEKDIDDYLYLARRLLFTSITEGLEFQLWSSTMDVSDKKWLAEEYMLTNLEVKCQMDLKEEQLRKERASRKRPRPADFKDEPPEGPAQPVPSEPFPELAIAEQVSSQN